VTAIRPRRAACAAAVLAVAGAALVTGAGAAHAADSLNINVREGAITLPKAVNGAAAVKSVDINVTHDLEGHVASATLTVDAGHLAGVADVVWPAGCTHTGSVGTCVVKVDDIIGGENQPAHFLRLPLKADRAAADGAHGTLDLTASAPGWNPPGSPWTSPWEPARTW
jgi:hypothetical protein